MGGGRRLPDEVATIDKLVRHRRGLRVFEEFLRSEFAVENIQFFSCVERFREVCVRVRACVRAQRAALCLLARWTARGACLSSPESYLPDLLFVSAF